MRKKPEKCCPDCWRENIEEKGERAYGEYEEGEEVNTWISNKYLRVYRKCPEHGNFLETKITWHSSGRESCEVCGEDGFVSKLPPHIPEGKKFTVELTCPNSHGSWEIEGHGYSK